MNGAEPSTIRQLADYATPLAGETDVARYDVRRLVPKFPWVLLVIASFSLASVLLAILTGGHRASLWIPLVPFFASCLFFLAFVLKLRGAYRASGALFLTTRRLVYVEDGRGLWRQRQFVASVDLAWVNGIQALAQSGRRMIFGLDLGRGKRNYLLRVETRAWTPIHIGATSTKASTALFEPDRDALQSVQELGARIRRLAAELPERARVDGGAP